jgi:hypothetical protein
VFRLDALSTVEKCIRKSDEEMYRIKEQRRVGRDE